MEKEVLKSIALERRPGSSVRLFGELPYAELERHRSAAVAALGKEVAIDGFRKGHVPENILVRHLGEMAVLTEMAERALGEAYPTLIEMHGLDVIGYPRIELTKLAKDNPLGFAITVAVVPDIELPDYMKIAKDVNDGKESKDVTDEDVTTQINDILRQKIAYERLQKKAAAHAHDHEHAGHDHDHAEHAHEHAEESAEKPEDIVLPELTDEYVKGLGQPGQFTSVDDFRTKIKEHLTIEKARDVDSRHRAKITDAIIEQTTMELPQVLIDAELNQMFSQMEEDLKRAQLTMDDYLAHIKKTKEDLKTEWTPSAEKRAKLQLVLNAIAKKEAITADPELVESEVANLLLRYKDADKQRVRTYVESVLANEAVMKKLEEAK
ncbi:MAG TPA: trigger factor [Candidatus Paceibacterota bacterium]|nr:trigger factor [Candidatus Paceibacterota bacterium]